MRSSLFSGKFSLVAKSAVIFCCFLSSVGCDRIKDLLSDTKQSVSEQPAESMTSTKQIQTETVPEQHILSRGVYSDLVLNIRDIKSSEQADFMRDLFEGLVIFDIHGNIQPAVAESWETKDNKTWIFTLRQDAKWSNGEAVTAEDFAQAWKLLALSSSPLRQYLAFIHIDQAQEILEGKSDISQLGIKAQDEYHLQISLDKPISYLPEMLAHIALLPAYSGGNSNKGELISNGAYKLTGQKADTISLVKNEFYWNAEKVSFPQVHYQKLADNTDVKKVDLVTDFRQIKMENVVNFPKLCTYFYEFNLKDPNLAKTAVRNALNSMISSHNIVRDSGLSGFAVSYFVPRNMEFESDESWQATVVEQILQQADFSEKNPLQFKLTYEQEGIHPNIANRLARSWSQSDLISVKMEPVNWSQLQEKRAKGDFQIIRSGWCADYNDPSAFLNLLYSKNPDNKTGFSQERVDKLLEKAQQTISEPERNELYRQVLLISRQEHLFLPIFQYAKAVYLNPTLQGFDIHNPTEVIYSKDLSRKPMRQKN
ncbi:peptide/nickel transport system substrate-binding protein [Basfia succiniciproducens]|uniref:Peptide/nickel transport system substrate-binding protein n=2 Tax=Basfia succiniciproducens TaxID=653940 RepID=A0A1G5AIR7_9PAST|nr:hypothetical protein A4G13_04245 [Basfia succiniciproducens]SCX77720.1 peptide/nickel transport system substrate-binding protein [Basfia succiniciproducens]